MRGRVGGGVGCVCEGRAVVAQASGGGGGNEEVRAVWSWGLADTRRAPCTHAYIHIYTAATPYGATQACQCTCRVCVAGRTYTHTRVPASGPADERRTIVESASGTITKYTHMHACSAWVSVAGVFGRCAHTICYPFALHYARKHLLFIYAIIQHWYGLPTLFSSSATQGCDPWCDCTAGSQEISWVGTFMGIRCRGRLGVANAVCCC